MFRISRTFLLFVSFNVSVWRQLCIGVDDISGKHFLQHIKNLFMPTFLMGCFPVDFQDTNRPLRTKSWKRHIKVRKRPIKEGKQPIKGMVLVGISVGCFMGCFRAPPPWWKKAPLKKAKKKVYEHSCMLAVIMWSSGKVTDGSMPPVCWCNNIIVAHLVVRIARPASLAIWHLGCSHRRRNRNESPNRRHFASLDLKKHADFPHRKPTSQDFRGSFLWLFSCDFRST